MFFAAPREFKPEEIEIAVNSGIGLFQIDIKNKKLKQVAPSRPMHPDEKNVIHLMSRLGYFKCAICDCYLNKKFASKGHKYKRQIAYFSKEPPRVFICDTCIQNLFNMLLPDLKERYAEKKEVKRLTKKQEVENKLKKFDRRLEIKSHKIESQIKNIKKYLKERISQRYKKAIKEIRSIKRELKSIKKLI